jgi:signal transduction histidine kinase/Flp pilus assembly protein TadD
MKVMQKILLSILFIGGTLLNVSAQQQIVVDSLKNVLETTTKDSVKVLTMNHLWWQYIGVKPETAKTYLQQALKLSREIKFLQGEARTLESIGTAAYYAGNYTEALDYYEQAYQIFEKIDFQKGIGSTLSAKGLVYFKQGTYLQALELNLRALRIGETNRDTTLRASCINNLGMIYSKQGDKKQAMSYFLQALVLHKSKKNRLGEAYTLNHIAEVFLVEDKLNDALIYFNRALEVFKLQNNQKGIAEILNNIGSVYIKQKKYSQATKSCREAFEIRQELNDKNGMAQSLLNIAISYRKAGLFENALNHALQSYDLAQELGIKEVLQEASFQVAEIYAFQRDYQKAFEYYQIYDITKDSLFNQENSRQLTEMRAKYEAQTKEQEINTLKVEQRATEAEIEQKNIINYSLISILLISLFFSGLIFFNYRAKQKANVALEMKNAEVNQTLIQLKSTQSQLIHSEKMASLGQLTAGIAHEINNPLNFVYAGISALEHTMLGFYDITDDLQRMMTEDDKEKIIEYMGRLKQIRSNSEYEEIKTDINALVKDIKVGAVRTTEIVKGLRNFSRLDEGKPKYGDIHNDLDAALMLLRAKLVKNITVSKKYGEKIPEIPALHGQLNQVFTNIIANAIHAMPNGGKLTIMTKMVHQEGVNLVSISIKDSGTGMPEQVKAKIFEPFFTTKDVGEGTGLGLSISYGIIRNHRGSIEVHSEIGKGTEFIITLPISE